MQNARKDLFRELRVTEVVQPSFMRKLFGPSYTRHRSFLFLQRAASELLETSSRTIVFQGRSLSVKISVAPPINMSGVKLSRDTESLLSEGPKYAPDLPVSRVDQQAAVHHVASIVPEDRQAFVGSATRSVCFNLPA